VRKRTISRFYLTVCEVLHLKEALAAASDAGICCTYSRPLVAHNIRALRWSKPAAFWGKPAPPVGHGARHCLTRSRHRAEAFQIEAQAGPGSGIPPAKMSQRVSLSDGEGLLPSLCSDEPRAERTDQRVRQRSTHRVRDFVFARFAERPVFARPNLWCMIFIDRERHGVIEQTEARSWAAKMSPNGNSAAMHAAIEPRRAGAE